MNRKDTATICALLKAAFPVWQTTPETIELYHAMLQDLDSEIVMRATQNWILTSEKFPTIAGIRKACAEVAGVLPPNASEAWAEVTKVANDVGIYGRRPAWSHPLITEVVNNLGYYHICQTDNIATVRAQFVKMYADFSDKNASNILSSKSFDMGAGKIALPHSTMVSSPTPQLRA